MRTTLTLDDDVAALLRRIRTERGIGLKDAVNAGLRQGLGQILAPAAPPERYQTRPLGLGRCLLPDVDNVADVLAVVEGDAFR